LIKRKFILLLILGLFYVLSTYFSWQNLSTSPIFLNYPSVSDGWRWTKFIDF